MKTITVNFCLKTFFITEAEMTALAINLNDDIYWSQSSLASARNSTFGRSSQHSAWPNVVKMAKLEEGRGGRLLERFLPGQTQKILLA